MMVRRKLLDRSRVPWTRTTIGDVGSIGVSEGNGYETTWSPGGNGIGGDATARPGGGGSKRPHNGPPEGLRAWSGPVGWSYDRRENQRTRHRPAVPRGTDRGVVRTERMAGGGHVRPVPDRAVVGRGQLAGVLHRLPPGSAADGSR